MTRRTWVERAFTRDLSERFFLRWHMTLIMASVILSGVLSSRLLLAFGMTSLQLRYVLAVLVSYAVFFGLIRLWILYVLVLARQSGGSGDVDVGGDVPSVGGGSGGGDSRGADTPFHGGGGQFGGAGASGSYAAGDPPSPAVPAAGDPPSPIVYVHWPAARSYGGTSRGSSGGGGGWSIDGDDDNRLLIAIALVALFSTICGAGIYLIWESPVMMTEAAFQAALACGVVKKSKKLAVEPWESGVFRATWKPFAAVLAAAGTFGFVASAYCPDALKLSEVLSRCVLKH